MSHRPLAWMALALAGVLPLASHAADNVCEFRAKGGLTMPFGTLNPSSGQTVNAVMLAGNVQAAQAGDCRNVTLAINADNGQHYGAGSRRMSNGIDFIPYVLNLPVSYPSPGNRQYLTFSFTGTIAGTAYQNASAGAYSDTVVLMVTP